jgi:hypothetical protein
MLPVLAQTFFFAVFLAGSCRGGQKAVPKKEPVRPDGAQTVQNPAMPHHRRPLTDKKLSWRESKEQLRCVFCGRKLDLLDARDMISRKTQETYAYRCAEDCRRRQKWTDQEKE